MYPVRRQISPHASRLRRDMTDVERAVWRALRNRQLEGFKFRRQATVGPFVVDFLCVEVAMVIEIDGGQHSEEADRARTGFLEARGLRVMRFWNSDVVDNFDGVIEAIRIALLKNEKKKTLTQPSPASGRGL
ncbi:endonuclease domain-containing protein [Sphingobium sp. Ant17]|uniref:endonuclease domain-containing protein n=1 Tax=Sphingobium sp. Ant17 TaxID=1461752 RepID=UPI00044A8C81|nr:endonuclease domain-containing protein [Sphingobium sp. Ant17]EXS67997.1 DNA methylase [Sphingobium sp. Ant17]|tara:strand:- start:1916 stop:2311 length:396 start_codon:yes stop_codon:yes gene_type:complete